ncbi:hypothetical protein ACIQCG_39740 [Streptomyces noursei]|uniref:hypothetical protein n=1 Tax=Streptomyces noursei TaxID=1971 RepID=UPI0036D3E59A
MKAYRRARNSLDDAVGTSRWERSAARLTREDALARDFQLDLGSLAEAAWAYVGDSVWEPLAPLSRSRRRPRR